MRAIRSKNIILEKEIYDGYIIIDGETIYDIVNSIENIENIDHVADYQDLVVMSGLVDSHVHINEPGRTEWEGFFTATQAALAGGVTTVVDMPLNCSPVTTTKEALEIKRQALGDQLHVDIGFWGGIVPHHLGELKELLEAGVLGCKAFMVHSGIDEFPEANEAVLLEAMKILASYNIPLLVHAELDCGADIHCHDPAEYQHYLESRPQSWEVEAIAMIIRLAKQSNCAVHVVHLSASDALDMIDAAKKDGVQLTVETCPHYLCLSAEEISHGQTQFKCAPPIRENSNREKLWNGLQRGTIDFVVSDHSPCTPQLKKLETGNFMDAWGGISSLQLALPNIWTMGQQYGITYHDISRWMSWRPSVFAGLSHTKGKIAKGYQADLVVWDPRGSFVLEPQDLRFKHKLSPYLGKSLQGRVLYTYLRGQLAYAEGQIVENPTGKALLFRNSKGQM